MKEAAELLSRYLRQRQELGEAELILSGQPLERLRELAFTDEEGDASAPADDSAGRESANTVAAGPSSPSLTQLVSVRSLQEVAEQAGRCTACSLATTRTNVVFGEGNPDADLVVVGEAPGADEDRTGRPFVGRAGRLLDKLLASIGFAREAVYICNVLKCRPPGNRNPLPEEVECCNPFLRRQLQLVRPRAILACGAFSARTLLESNEPISRLRGMSHQYEGIPLIPTYHPAALLRNPAWIRPAWDDLQRLRSLIDS